VARPKSLNGADVDVKRGTNSHRNLFGTNSDTKNCQKSVDVN